MLDMFGTLVRHNTRKKMSDQVTGDKTRVRLSDHISMQMSEHMSGWWQKKCKKTCQNMQMSEHMPDLMREHTSEVYASRYVRFDGRTNVRTHARRDVTGHSKTQGTSDDVSEW